ncbi:MAG TPA: hypothetical protein V6D29_13585 [Leptolyngbyaceae cyanobacterium]
MDFNRFFSVGLFSALLTSIGLPAAARPYVASGDLLLETNFQGCLSRAETFIAELGVASDRGQIDRTGYFEDGTFRILCYGTGAESVAVVFAAHEESGEVASQFVELALKTLAQSQPAAPSQAQNVGRDEKSN